MIMFIVNPNSGAKKDAEKFTGKIKKHFPGADIVLTERAGHAIDIARAAAQKGYSRVIACGGDGTINEVARGLMGSSSALGIIPRGSGNGFARELGMSLNNETALKQLASAKKIHADMGRINDDLFVNVAGIGIEADIAHAFATHGTRGIFPYFWLGAKIFLTYKPRTVVVKTDKGDFTGAPLTLVFANGRQYGTNFRVAPQASLTDGLLDMVQVLNKNLFYMLITLPTFFNYDFRPGNPTEVERITKASVFTGGPVYYHVDGEPKQSTGDTVEVELLPACLYVLTAKL